MTADVPSAENDTECLPVACFSLTFQSGFPAVRAVLGQVDSFATVHDIPDPSRVSVQIVLAEALNNITEHAYRHAAGPITLSATFSTERFRIEILDKGVPLPTTLLDHAPVATSEPFLGTPEEGGFGWPLILQLTETLHYSRHGGQNRLKMTLKITV